MDVSCYDVGGIDRCENDEYVREEWKKWQWDSMKKSWKQEGIISD